MQLEEKRRHIEEEKRRMREQWTEERAKLGQQAFWLAVGKETEEDLERMEREKEEALVSVHINLIQVFCYSLSNSQTTKRFRFEFLAETRSISRFSGTNDSLY